MANYGANVSNMIEKHGLVSKVKRGDVVSQLSGLTQKQS
jgi:hypothetical protein